MASAMDAAVQQNSQAIDTSGIGANTMEGLSMGMSLAQRQQQIDQKNQEMQFQQQQHEMQKHDWMHDQIKSALSENDPKLRGVILDSLDEQFPKIFGGKRIDPKVLELMQKSPNFMDKVGAMTRVREAARTNNFDKISDMDKGIVSGMTSSDISSTLTQLNSVHKSEDDIIKALTTARVATPQAAAASGMSKDDLQAQMSQANPTQARVTSQQAMQAQNTINKDAPLNAYKMRLDGASRVNDLIQDAEAGKVKTNAAFLGQLNAEIARLETGSQSPGLGASEKTELVSAASQFEKLKERFTGKPTDSVSPALITQVKGTMGSMIDSYQQAVHDRYGVLSSGATEVQKPIFKSKWDQDIKNYSSRFGHWKPGVATPEATTEAPASNGASVPQASTGQAPPKRSQADMEQIEASARERLRQARKAQETKTPLGFTEDQVKETYKRLTGKDLE